MLARLLLTPTAQLGKASRFAAFLVKLCIHCARLLRLNRAGQQAAALSYHMIFGLVPVAIVMLLIFQALPGYSEYAEKMKDFAYDWVGFSTLASNGAEGAEDLQEIVALTERVDGLVAQFFTGTHKGSITLISVLVVIWAALALLSTIEKAFNNIWHVRTGRSFLHRVINYWAVMTLGPLLVAAGIYAASRFWNLGQIQDNLLSDTQTVLSNIAPTVFSYVVATVVFFLLYYILPNTKVRAGAAIFGAAVAALLWVAAKNLYGLGVTELKLYSTVYGMLALIPITVMWIYITWLIVLFGLQLTFTVQHLKSLDAAEIASAKRTEQHFIANDLTAINVAREIGAAFEADEGPVSSEVICSKLDMPAEFGDRILNRLIDSGLIAKTSDPKVGFIPARDPANIKLSDVAAALAEAGFAQSPADQSVVLEQIAQSQRDTLGQYCLKEILDVRQAGADSD